MQNGLVPPRSSQRKRRRESLLMNCWEGDNVYGVVKRVILTCWISYKVCFMDSFGHFDFSFFLQTERKSETKGFPGFGLNPRLKGTFR